MCILNSEKQCIYFLSVTGKRSLEMNYDILYINPLSPHDALKHHFTSLKTDLIFLQLRVLERKFP